MYANRILRSYREALRKAGAEAELAKAKAALGWGFMSTFVPLGYFGFMEDLMLWIWMVAEKKFIKTSMLTNNLNLLDLKIF